MHDPEVDNLTQEAVNGMYEHMIMVQAAQGIAMAVTLVALIALLAWSGAITWMEAGVILAGWWSLRVLCIRLALHPRVRRRAMGPLAEKISDIVLREHQYRA